MILIGLHNGLVLCHSFKGCALPPSILFHALCLSPIQTHKVATTILWRDNQKITDLEREIFYNIHPPNPTLYWSHWRPWGHPNSSLGVPGGQPALTCLGIWSSKGCHASTCSGIRQSQGSQDVITPRPTQGPNSLPSRLDLPGDLISRRLSCLSLPGDLRPDPGCLALRLQQYWVG